jgi:hypothetical protein
MPSSEGIREKGRSKARAYLNELLRNQKKGNIWINVGEVSKDLNLKIWNFWPVLQEAEFNRIKSTQTSSPEVYAKKLGVNPEKFKKWLEKNNITDDKWYDPEKKAGETATASKRRQWLESFKVAEERAPLMRKIPKGYITEQQLSKLLYGGQYSDTILGAKLSPNSPIYDPALAQLIKKLKPTGSLPPPESIRGKWITYYKNPSSTFLTKFKKLSRAHTLSGPMRGHIETILKNDGLRKLFTKFDRHSELPSWTTMKAAFPKGTSENTMASAVMHVAKIMKGKGMKGTEDIKVPYNSMGGTLILRRMNEGQMWGNPWATAMTRDVLNTIDEKLGRGSGTFIQFKADLRKVLQTEGIPLYQAAQWNKARTKIIKPEVPGFNINEVLQTRGQFGNKAYPYTQFADLAEGHFNQKKLTWFQNRLNADQAKIIQALKKNDIAGAKKIIRGFRDYRIGQKEILPKSNLGDIYIAEEWADKVGKKVGGSYKGEAYTKPLSKIYKQIDVDIWKEQYGLDLEKYAKEKGINLDVKGGKPIEQVLTPGYRNTLLKNLANIRKDFQNNTGGVCKIFGSRSFASGGSAVGCVREFDEAVKNDPPGLMKKMASIDEGATGVLGKVRNLGRGFLGLMGKFGPTAGKYGAIAAAGAIAQPLVKQFRNDDPFTYLTDPDQQAGMLEALIEGERPKPRSEALDLAHTAGTVGATAAVIPGTGRMYDYRRGLLESKIPKAGPVSEAGLTAGDYLKRHGKGFGKLRAGAGVGMKLLSGMFTPAGILATEPLRIAQMRREGESWGEVAKSPTLWMGPAFADTMTRIATSGMKPSSRLAKALSLGISRPMLKTISRKFGMPGLALSAGLSGYDLWKDYKKKRGFFASDED